MAPDADVLQDTRAIRAWLLEPLLAAGSNLIISNSALVKPASYLSQPVPAQVTININLIQEVRLITHNSIFII
jgi:hypothetical protein